MTTREQLIGAALIPVEIAAGILTALPFFVVPANWASIRPVLEALSRRLSPDLPFWNGLAELLIMLGAVIVAVFLIGSFETLAKRLGYKSLFSADRKHDLMSRALKEFPELDPGLQQELAGLAFRPWLPYGLWRKVSMLMTAVAALGGFAITGSGYCLVGLLMVPLSSPRWVGEVLVTYGEGRRRAEKRGDL